MTTRRLRGPSSRRARPGPSGPGGRGQPAPSAFEQAFTLQRSGRLADAEALYREILKKQPNHFESLHLLGVIESQRGDHAAGLLHIDAALKVRPESADALNNRGMTLQGLGRLKDALASFDEALSRKPESPGTLFNRGSVLARLTRFDEALASFDTAIALKPHYPEALHDRGHTLFELNRLDEAVASFDAAIALKSDYARAFNSRGLVLRAMGRLDEALASYDRAIVLKPDYAGALFNRALLFQQQRRLDKALADFDRAIELEPIGAVYNSHGVVLKELGQPEAALASYDKALAVDGRNFEALNNRGNVLKDLKRLDEALVEYDRAIAIKPDYAEAFGNRGIALMELKRYDEALASYDRALSLQPNYARVLNNRGITLTKMSRLDDALASYEKAIAIRPNYAKAFLNRAITLAELNRFDEALQNYDRSIAIEPSYAALNNRGVVLKDLGRYEEALASYDQAIKLEPSNSEAFSNRGVALKELGRNDEALIEYDRAILLRPDYAEAYNNRGNSLLALKRIDEALASYDRAIELNATDAEAYKNRGICRLLAGRIREGWADYDWRWQTKELLAKRPKIPAEEWQGQSLAGKRLAVYGEQGLGDNIQFVRYVPRLVALGANVTLIVSSRVMRLLKPLTTNVSVTNKVSSDEAFDYSCALLSIPRWVGADDPVTNGPYLRAEEKFVAKWKDRIGTHGFKVGIAWQGSPHGKIDFGRSIPLSNYVALARIPGVRLISLQKEHGLDQLANVPEDVKIEQLGADFDSGPDAFTDTAAVMTNLDLIITSDTSIAHLAGALGRPTWVALKHVPDWRWLLDRPDSPWYPTMRLFRQQTNGDWRSVFDDIESALRSTVAQPDAPREITSSSSETTYGRASTRLQGEHPDEVQLNNRGNALKELGRLEEALASFDAAIRIRADIPEILYNRGNVLMGLGRMQEAVESFGRAIELRPEYGEAFNNRGVALRELKRIDEAIADHNRAITLLPDPANALINRGICRLLTGQYQAGWSDYESRWSATNFPARRPIINAPTWKGEDLAGRHIAIFTEQGAGDAIQFSRYVRLLVQRGAKVTFFVAARLHRLLSRLCPGIEFASELKHSDSFDYCCALMSLPLWLAPDPGSLPNEVPYLASEESLVRGWDERLGNGGFKVGIAWQGNPEGTIDSGRSIPLAQFFSLARIPGVRLISLQKEHGLEQLGDVPRDVKIELLGGEFDSGPDAFVDTAAVMANLDLIITSDTSIAHLAGALGRSTWVALKYVPDWRWMLDREDSPWYPRMRLFRQRIAGDWNGVFSTITQELTRLARDRGGAAPQNPNDASIAPVPLRSEIKESYERGVAFHQAGRLNEAETAYEHVLRLQADHFDALRLQGVIALQRGDHELAVRKFDAALHVKPNSPDVLNNRGLALTRLERIREALECFDNAIALDSTSIEFFFNRGNALMASDRAEDAVTSFDQALALNANYVEALSQRGNALIKLKRFEEAVASFDTAIAIRPSYAQAHNNRGVALKELDRLTEALESCDRAIAIDPDYSKAHTNRGNVLKELGRLDEAIADLNRAVALNPNSPEAHITRGVILKEAGRIDDAIASYDRALALKPDYADALKNRGMALLFAGKFREGWRDYDWRWEASDFPGKRPGIHAPLWMGEPITGKRIVVYVEQGNGDIIQFSRYLPLLVRSGAKVTLLCPPRLKRLLAPVTKDIRVVDTIGPSETFEFHCGLMSLPRWFDTTAQSVPSGVPYLTAEEHLVAHWNAKIGQKGFKIGIAWQGSPIGKIDNGRSVPLSEFIPLARISGVRLISLQKEHGLDQLAHVPEDVTIELLGDFDSGPDAFTDTAAVIANLDLVVTSDTSIAHLAGALGRPTWLALKRVPDWRWMREREDTPWYPTMRLFRQKTAGDWRSVFLAVERELAVLVGGPAPPNSMGDDAKAVPSSAQHLYDRGVSLHQTGRLSEAEAVYQEILRLQPDDFSALHLLGVLALQRGDHDLAIQRIDAALSVNSKSPEAHNNRGLALLASKRFAEALDSFARAIALDSSSVEPIYNRGVALMQLQRLEDAVLAFDQAIALKPDHADALNNRGNVLNSLERYNEALTNFDQALAISSDDARILNNRGIALKELGRFEEAIASYDRAIALKPKYAKALKNKGNALVASNNLDEAIVNFDLAIAFDPTDSGAHYARGNALKDKKRTHEALASYDRAIVLNADYAHAYNSRGNALMELKRLDESIASYDRAIHLLPQYGNAIYNRGLCKLLGGNYREGWADYEWRWEATKNPIKRPNFSARIWRGEPVRGRRIFVYSEQGLGDVIQFSRYLPVLSEQGADITFAALPRMERILKKLTAGIRVVGMIQYSEVFEYSCALLSLPLCLGTNDVALVPKQVPYLEAEHPLIAKWKARIGDHGFKIGIVWQGSPEGKVDRDRSIPLLEFASLSRIPGVRLISLQKQHGLNQLAHLPEEVKVELLGDEFDSGPDAFIDTAAVMANLDLVITSDTSIAHLAGALARPTWVALKFVPDWRWMLEREDSPWYPTMRLFRQEKDGDWRRVFSRIEQDLRLLVKKKTPQPALSGQQAQKASMLAPGPVPPFDEARACHQSGRLNEAERIYRQILAEQPDHFGSLHLLGVIEYQRGHYAAAVQQINAALSRNPDSAEAHNNRGLALMALKRWKDALASFDTAIGLNPSNPELHNNRGNALAELDLFHDSLASFDSAITLKPDYAEAFNNRGIVLKELGRLREALESYDQALTLNPASADVNNNRGVTLKELGRFDEALASYDRALATRPNHVEALFNRGNVLRELKRHDDALACYEKVYALNPDHPGALSQMGLPARAACDWDRTKRLRPEIERSVARGTAGVSPFTLLGYADNPSLQLQCANQFVNSRIATSRTPLWTGELWRNDKIRVAYLSPDFREHAVARLTAGLFEAHDRTRFEILGVSFGPDDGSELRARLKTSFDRFYDVRSKTDDEIARLINELRIDIAIDLTGHTRGSRTGILAQRPAPIQVNYLGFPGTMGADFIDYIIADKVSLPFDQQPFYSEKIVHLPESFQVNDSRRRIAERTPSRSDFELPDEGFVFCCFNNSYKITPDVFDIWMRLLKQIDGSVLWLLGGTPDVRRNLAREAQRRGVSTKRLIFAARLPPDEHLARYRRADLFLDTLPCSAGATASDALWAGLPLLTCTGETFVSRMAGSLLNAACVSELITPNLGSYEALAFELATKPSLLKEIRNRLARNRSTCPLFDTDRFSRHLEAAYLKMWDLWQKGERPRNFSVEPLRLPSDSDPDRDLVFHKIQNESTTMPKPNSTLTISASSQPIHSPAVPVSWGELMDKISILEIKRQQFTSVEAAANVQRELDVLERAAREIDSNPALAPLMAQLKEVNETLWDIEDRIRAKEADKSFDSEFVELARAVYFHNDKRGALKRQINRITSSELVEEKQYTAYGAQAHDVAPRPAKSEATQPPLFENSNLRLKKCRHGAMMFHANDIYIGRSLDLYGEFSEGEVELFKQFIHPGMTVVDVGANIGAHTLYFAEAVGSAGRVIAFEPQQVLYQILCGNIALNLFRNVTPISAGLGSVSGSITVPAIDYAQGGNFGGIALGRRKNGDQVPLRTLDSYELEACHLIKIDVEGMERDVLEGAASLLGRHQPILYVENDRAEKSKDLIQWLFDRDYRLYWHMPALFNPKNHYGVKENVFGGTISVNMLCIPRSKAIVAKGFREITAVDDDWRTGPSRNST